MMSLRRLSQAAQEAAALLARRWSSSSASCSSCTAPRRQLASATPFHLAMPGVALQQGCWSAQPAQALVCSRAYASLRAASGFAASQAGAYPGAASNSLAFWGVRGFSAVGALPRGRALAAQSGSRGFAATSKLRPKFRGGKMKAYSRYKERFKVTGTGLIKNFRTGHRHKRWSKTSKQLRNLRKPMVVHSTYATIMKKLGFKMRTF